MCEINSEMNARTVCIHAHVFVWNPHCTRVHGTSGYMQIHIPASTVCVIYMCIHMYPHVPTCTLVLFVSFLFSMMAVLGHGHSHGGGGGHGHSHGGGGGGVAGRSRREGGRGDGHGHGHGGGDDDHGHGEGGHGGGGDDHGHGGGGHGHGGGGHDHGHGGGGDGHGHGGGGDGHGHGEGGYSHKRVGSEGKPCTHKRGSCSCKDVPKSSGSWFVSLKKKVHVENINVRAAFIHVIGDLIQSVGVVIAGYVIKFKV